MASLVGDLRQLPRRFRLLLGGCLCLLVIAGAFAARERIIRKREEVRSAELAAARVELEARLSQQSVVAKTPPVSISPKPESASPLTLLSITPERRQSLEAALPAFDPGAEVEVPFTRFVTANHTARFLLMPAGIASALVISDVGRISFPRRGVPLKLVETAPGRFAVFFREAFSSVLYLYLIGGSVEREIRITAAGDAEPILRDAVVHDGVLFAVLYDNERLVNEVFRFAPNAPETASTQFVRVAAVPSLEDPAGSTYEMISTIRLVTVDQSLVVVGGNLLAVVPEGGGDLKPIRLPGCLRSQDVVPVGGTVQILCLARSQGVGQPMASAHLATDASEPPYTLMSWSPARGLTEAGSAGLAELPELDRDGRPAAARGPSALRHVLLRDLAEGYASGVMELATNNVEGRVPWSQIYFLNGLLDLLLIARSDEEGLALYGPLVADAKRRLDIEVYLLDRLVGTERGLVTRGFTVRRAPAIFAVQTSRILLLFNRYQREVRDGARLATHQKLRSDVLSLRAHIDEMAIAGPGSREPPPGMHYLRWPKGSAFYFDGLNVPYNHQNEWAYAVFDSLGAEGMPRSSEEMVALRQARDIVRHFLSAVAPQSAFPQSGVWPYWWGRARDGWTAEDGVSVNKPAFAGDKLLAWISFRSIDAQTVLAAQTFLAEAATSRVRSSLSDLVSKGLLYPFVAVSFAGKERIPLPNPVAAAAYARQTSPVDLPNAVWAHFALARAHAQK